MRSKSGTFYSQGTKGVGGVTMNDNKRLLYGAWLKNFQGLAWQFNYAQSSLVTLNDWQHPLLGSNTERLIKDYSFRSQFLTSADLSLFNEFWDVLGSGSSATIMFTVHKVEKVQFLLHGWSDPDSNAILGYLQVAPPVYTEEHAVTSIHSLLFRASYPVFVMAYKSNQITGINASALKLFGYADHEKCTNIGAKALFTAASYKMVQKWLSKGLSTTWAGNVSFKDSNGKIFLCHVRISPQENPAPLHSQSLEDNQAQQKQYSLLRFAFLEYRSQKSHEKNNKQSSVLLNEIQNTHSLHDALACILNAVPEADGIVFSDINARKGNVCVYGVGESFDQMPWGKNYPYDGTIAQVIEHHNHSYLVVDNTKDSIKVIDWALFIPYGVRSYFAKAFFFRGRLHAVLIFTSTKVNTFARCSQTGENSFHYIDAAFTSAIQRWRQEKA